MHERKSQVIAWLVTASLVLTVGGGSLLAQHPGDRVPEPPTIGQPAPPWDVDDWFQLPDGKQRLDVSDFAGKVVYLYCFQAWCPGCHSRGFPTLKELVERYDESDDVAFVAVQTVFEGFEANTLAKAKATAKRYGLSIPFGHDAGPKGRGSRLMEAYGNGGTPWTLIIDRAGKLRYSEFFIKTEDGAKLLDQLIAEPVPNPLIGRTFGSVAGLRTLRGEVAPSHADWTLYRWWTDGCPHCRASVPAINALTTRMRTRGLDMAMVAVYHQKRPNAPSDAELFDYLGELGYSSTRAVAVDPEWTKLRSLMRRGKLDQATSVSFLVDRDAVVRWVHPGPRLHPSDEPRYATANAEFAELERLLTEHLPAREPDDRDK